METIVAIVTKNSTAKRLLTNGGIPVEIKIYSEFNNCIQDINSPKKEIKKKNNLVR